MNSPAVLRSLLFAAACSACFGQGSLTPPGAPAATMKTLDQLESRTPIATLPFTISARGSYYLAGNLSVTTGDAITINADNVTLDLNGHSLNSTASPASGAGVRILGARQNVTVRNGQIQGTTTFSASVFTPGGFTDGVLQTNAGSNIEVSDVNVARTGTGGVSLVIGATTGATRCRVAICSGVGIQAGNIDGCSAETTGESAISGNVINNCTGSSVGLDGTDHGISGQQVTNSRGTASLGNGVNGQTVTNCSGQSNSGIGIVATTALNCVGTSVSASGISGSLAQNCSGTSSSGTGVGVGTAINCVGTSTSGTAGISATGTASFCRGTRNGGTAITAAIAIGCNVSGTGTVSAPEKHLGTP